MPTTIIKIETRKVSDKVSGLAKDVIAIHTKAAKALEKASVDTANEVLRDEKSIDAKYLDIEADLEFLITKAPVDKDLRRTLAYLFITKELTRIADYAKHMARFVVRFGGKITASSTKRILILHATVLRMLEQMGSVLAVEDFAKALELAKSDKLIDEKLAELRMDVVRSIAQKGTVEDVEERVLVLDVLNRLERTGDRIVNICEMIVYIHNSQHVFLD